MAEEPAGLTGERNSKGQFVKGGRPHNKLDNRRCSIDGCESDMLARSWCSSHYQYWLRYGDPLGRPTLVSIEQRFWEKVERTATCWFWKAGRNPDGYGNFRINGKTEGAHRVAWKITYGAIPDGRQVLHRCDTPPCVNPNHLFLGDHDINMSDKAVKGRAPGTGKGDDQHGLGARNRRKTHCKNGHAFSPENTYTNPQGHRACRICQNVSLARYRQKKRKEGM